MNLIKTKHLTFGHLFRFFGFRVFITHYNVTMIDEDLFLIYVNEYVEFLFGEDSLLLLVVSFSSFFLGKVFLLNMAVTIIDEGWQ